MTSGLSFKIGDNVTYKWNRIVKGVIIAIDKEVATIKIDNFRTRTQHVSRLEKIK